MVADRLAALGLPWCADTHTSKIMVGAQGLRQMGLLLVNVPVSGIKTLDA